MTSSKTKKNSNIISPKKIKAPKRGLLLRAFSTSNFSTIDYHISPFAFLLLHFYQQACPLIHLKLLNLILFDLNLYYTLYGLHHEILSNTYYQDQLMTLYSNFVDIILLFPKQQQDLYRLCFFHLILYLLLIHQEKIYILIFLVKI